MTNSWSRQHERGKILHQATEMQRGFSRHTNSQPGIVQNKLASELWSEAEGGIGPLASNNRETRVEGEELVF